MLWIEGGHDEDMAGFLLIFNFNFMSFAGVWQLSCGLVFGQSQGSAG